MTDVLIKRVKRMCRHRYVGSTPLMVEQRLLRKLQAKEYQALTVTIRNQEGKRKDFTSKKHGPDFRFGLQDCKTIDPYCFKPSSLKHLVTVTLEK